MTADTDLTDSQLLKMRSPLIAALLSFILPGLGHLYLGRPKLGAIYYVLLILLVISIRFLAFDFITLLSLLGIIIVYYLFVIIHSVVLANRISSFIKRKYNNWMVYATIIILQIVITEFFPKDVLDSSTPINFATIPTPAMSPTLEVGDYLAIARSRDVKQNDVVIFRYPEDTSTFYMKRCIGVSGNVLEIKKGIAFVNGTQIDTEDSLKFMYLVQTNGQQFTQRVIDEYGLTDFYFQGNGIYQIHLTNREAKNLSKLEIIQKIEKQVSNDSWGLFPPTNYSKWTSDNYGPILVPGSGSVIDLTKENIDIYGLLIEQENPDGVVSDSTVMLNGEVVDSYTFKRNYFFMLGDNRHNSLDSRYWGFVKESYIIGKAIYLYWAKDSDRIGNVVN